ncbi:bifunctional folylpolyglutamate synthase/dihydrofolate synthase [Mucilaginibacter robiniae]|uniref:Dihydrofolate synthase/folylpolyglutamate synthase n=1 Tax=Mucilaginibacter robiniae TaxID=2728022 RepID=A0A7L5E2Q9_9SPHI|nr:folylpolyglutamate synthase/dihydrofolate synthase family protein [Mucilaginibacter robiniae]QJD97415.1 bifunctional folylpolyglutamate synthase/dihydrofolate synthase [Mucilaginibacter robiniae]
MNYPETLDYLYNQLPMFTRVGASAFKKDLTNTLALCKLLGNPQHQFKSVHIGGTNGKGSTSHMLAAILQIAGYKTGLYTSPHLKDFRERICINGKMISEQEVVAFVAQHQVNFENIQPSFFEMTVALAFDAFARHKVDIAIIEVGLGGRLDSTNVITPLLSVITNIGWDHMNLLGNTLPEIAGEKAGIIKPQIPIIVGEYQPEVAGVFTKTAQEQQSPLTFASEQWQVEVISSQLSEDKEMEIEEEKQQSLLQSYSSSKLLNIKVHGNHAPATQNPQPEAQQLQLDLTGTYQLKNVKTVLSVVDELRQQGFSITNEHVCVALEQVKTLTGLNGRWQILSQKPLTICDTGHNPDGIQEVLKNIQAVPYQHLHWVLGMVNDKDASKVLSMLPQQATYYFCKPDIPRGLEAETLQHQASQFNLQGSSYPSVKSALQAAQQQAGSADLVFAGGSTFVVAEIV